MPTTRGALPTSKPKNSSARAPESGFDCAISPAQTGALGDNMWIVPAMAMVALLSVLSGAARAADASPGAEGFGRRALGGRRSDEHTSELQSLMRILYDVFCVKKQTMDLILLVAYL